ncbi:hypothetical protein [Intrasporangium calvum]|uniref:hypothetical protein n=1 Tax=Intrasporangium calvum TaxID=53358 RepID=UPI0019023C2D|nr:hypothetical protein [Intrasporangium calvum]
MGHRLADALFRNLNGDFDDQLELKAEFAATLNAVVVEGDDATGGSDLKEIE